MRIFIFLPLLFFFTSKEALADFFQIFDGSRPYYISYAPVSTNGNLYGYTDLYGRIKVDLPRGQHEGVIVFRGESRRVRFVIDGRPELKRIRTF